MNVDNMIRLARQHLCDNHSNESSARACLADALKAHDRGDSASARMWALKSLRYSVGIFHPAYKAATAA